ncbi:MAG: glycoside hydrolase family 88 protein [Verrucomicrobia bacterium]|nr:glycoside hydrolase family 88 protein [Verrucomicrobiota bacterium]MDA1087255.1 glycoside hydrolase family 88 protein [Verrucomicrobiota bacterium]
MKINSSLAAPDLAEPIARLWDYSAACIDSIEETCPPGSPSPVFTIDGRYTAQGWTEWTQGFQYGSAILQYDATDNPKYLALGKDRTVRLMAPHVTHVGVHDHGFNNVSTYGNLLRLAREGRFDASQGEIDFYEMALKASSAVQARRWTPTQAGGGFIYSFNGPHSLFADTIRSLRALAMGHKLGHVLMDEQDLKVSLLARLVQHAQATADYSVYYGEGRDTYDVRGRVAHESIFNTNNGCYRCANSQQGYSPFSTWTRGLAWIVVGYPEQLEFLDTLDDRDFESMGGRSTVSGMMLMAARAACDFYIDQMPADGIPYWDTGAPGLASMPDHIDRPADPYNSYEPVDSSAAAIAAQGLLRLGHYLEAHGDAQTGKRYWQAGLTTFKTLLDDPYLSPDPAHQGLVLHSVYHRPNNWDHVPEGSKVPNGESSMWGDYHARETALYLQRIIRDEPYYTFFGPTQSTS